MEKNNMTAVEWLAEKMEKRIKPGNQLVISIWLDQAKQMEKAQIIQAWYVRALKTKENHYQINPKSAEEYYNETYGNNTSNTQP